MRVVHQLISYFKAHGALSPAQLDQLRNAGFLPDWLDDLDISEAPDDFFDQEPDDGDHKLPSGLGKHPEDEQYFRSEKPWGTEVLCRALDTMSSDWTDELSCLGKLAGSYSSSNETLTWQRALPVLHKSGAERSYDVLKARLADNEVTLSELCDLLDLTSYRYVYRPGHRPTKASGAYRALMRTYDFSSLGKYAWILKHQEVNTVFQLVRVKRTLLNALSRIFENDKALLEAKLRNSTSTNLFWAFVILRSALLEDPWMESRTKSALGATYLDKLWPPNRVLRRAALYAVFMAPEPVLSFLTHDFDIPEDARGNPPWKIPDAWTTSEEKHFIKFKPRSKKPMGPRI